MTNEPNQFSLNIVDDIHEQGDPNSMVSVDLTKNMINENARGGTELLLEELYSHLPSDLWKEFNFIQSRVRDEFFDDRSSILWLHDLPGDPESEHLKDKASRDRFEKIVFVSHWQQDKYCRYLGIPYEEGVVIKNAINEIPVHEKPKDGKIRLIYFSTPHRGLNVLESAVRALSQTRNDFEVDVFSSFELYGNKDNDRQFQVLYDRLEELDCVNYYGTVSNDQIRRALTQSHILAYPSIYEESSCRVLLESMAAGCLAVVPNYGALTETGTDYAWLYNWESDPARHAEKFASILNNAIDAFWNPGVQSILKMQTTYYNNFYGWNMRVHEWVDLLSSLKRNKK